MIYLIDTNVLVYSCNTQSPFYLAAQRALSKLTSANETLCVAPQVLTEFWSVATRPTPKGIGWSVARANSTVAAWEVTFQLIEETRQIYPSWRQFCQTHNVTNLRVFDARLAVVMNLNQVGHIITFNGKHFANWPGITAVDPQTL